MSNFDDWGAGSNKDWNSEEGDSDFEFSWDPEGNFHQALPPKKSRIGFVKRQPLWLKVASSVGATVIVLFVFSQSGGVAKLRTMGILRESISAEAMCLNGLQVASELSASVFSAAVMNSVIDHADRVMAQQSGNAVIDEAAWAVADSAYVVQDVVGSLPNSLGSADLLLGDILETVNASEVKSAALVFAEATERLGASCDSLARNSSSVATASEMEAGYSPYESGDIQVFEPKLVDAFEPESGVPLVDPHPKSSIAFVTFNVCHARCKDPAPNWDTRRERVATVIVNSGADVLGLQEVTNWTVGSSETQWTDIQTLVAKDGFVGPEVNEKFNECVRPVQVTCVDTSRILFNQVNINQVTTKQGVPAAGYTTLGSIAPSIDSKSRNRTVAWAYLEGAETEPFLVFSMHMDSDKTAGVEESRRAIAKQLDFWVENLNQEIGIEPVAAVLLADLNSFDARQPEGAQYILRQNGWIDSWYAPVQRNIMFSTVNYTPDTRHYGGWPPKPRLYKEAATRLDYIFARGRASFEDYEVLVWLKADGTFNGDFQASDHQPVRATLVF